MPQPAKPRSQYYFVVGKSQQAARVTLLPSPHMQAIFCVLPTDLLLSYTRFLVLPLLTMHSFHYFHFISHIHIYHRATCFLNPISHQFLFHRLGLTNFILKLRVFFISGCIEFKLILWVFCLSHMLNRLISLVLKTIGLGCGKYFIICFKYRYLILSSNL